MNGDYLDAALQNPDMLLSTLIGGMARAEQRHRAKLRTVDAEGNPINEPHEAFDDRTGKQQP